MRWLGIVATSLLLQSVLTQELLHDEGEEECLADIDLMIVLDGSGSVGKENFNLVLNWVKRVAEGMHINHGHVQIGVVQYSHYFKNRPWNRQSYIRTEIELGEYNTVDDFDAAVDAIEYQGYKTYTAHALNKTLNYDFVVANNRYPVAKRALILLTDGRATDAPELPPVIRRAEEDMGVIMYAVGVGNFSSDELRLITHNHENRVFELENFDDLDEIVAGLQFQLRASCDCDSSGSSGGECDPCSGQCMCKTNVVGRRCGSCDVATYGFESGEGCLPCDCNPFGTLNVSVCDATTGQCDCIPGAVEGRDCGRCAEGNFGFPECRPCDCNGFSDSCDSETGVCPVCLGGRRGDHCEICPIGQYKDDESGDCLPCLCNGNIDPEDEDACNPDTGRCEKCLHNTAGDNCEKCQDYYHGDATTQSCIKCVCDLTGTDPASCEGDECECGEDGSCPCLANVEGDSCDRCSPGSWLLIGGIGCIKCQCDGNGMLVNTTCDADTGECECHENYTGSHCTECAEGFAPSEADDKCYSNSDLGFADIIATEEPDPTQATTTTELKTTTTPRTTTTRKHIRVNPGWSPCTSCGGQRWPSYCRGWTCRTRWPYYQQAPSSRRCYAWHWGCRSSVESYNNRFQAYSQPQYRSRYAYGSVYSQPSYYRGYNHHYRSNNRIPRNPIRYNLYRNF